MCKNAICVTNACGCFKLFVKSTLCSIALLFCAEEVIKKALSLMGKIFFQRWHGNTIVGLAKFFSADIRPADKIRRWRPNSAAQGSSSQPLLGRSSPYYEGMWRRYWCLTFFQIVDICLSCEDMAWQSCAMVPRWRFFASCISSEPCAAHFRHAFSIRSKAHHVWTVEVW